MESIRLSLETGWAEQILGEINEGLQLDVAFDLDGPEPLAEVSRHIVYFREHPGDAFFIDRDPLTASRSGTDDVRINLKPSDQLLKFVLAFRALKRERGIGIAA